ncbi:Predicted nucleic acid-binding protein, contains PIN domain [Modestobacter sp. DSM 44400]|uniref:type II toxin-antitoxin system VapC family toxin n=1 Tax=Modestobacter sp. DSM 44400 TaxID=1550230 RepID=UPI000895A455|nr:type II toxin-antitoxin system VapC family toxin [Modestobacter sp. DSM 44400]SDY46658.1 Predicted nucleic acid-binding protein, contains PIN domain [Modestobacter sp. DSM 44400]
MIVLDASAAVAALLRDGAARAVLAEQQVHAPHLVDAEVAHAFRRLSATGQLTAEVVGEALGAWIALGLTRHPVHPLLPRVWQLRENVTAYDATYVALAEGFGCALVTADRRLARASGPACPITVVPN